MTTVYVVHICFNSNWLMVLFLTVYTIGGKDMLLKTPTYLPHESGDQPSSATIIPVHDMNCKTTTLEQGALPSTYSSVHFSGGGSFACDVVLCHIHHSHLYDSLHSLPCPSTAQLHALLNATLPISPLVFLLSYRVLAMSLVWLTFD